MSDWVRSTRSVDAGDLPPDTDAALRAHVETHGLGDLLAESLACIETISRMSKKGPFGRDEEEVRVAALVTPRWLIWAIRADRPEITVMSAPLKDVTVQDYASTSMAALVPDSGIEVTGSFTDAFERGSAFIGLGPEPAATAFAQALRVAALAAKH